MTAAPLLRAPPFPWANASVSRSSAEGNAAPDPASLFATIREARVGGTFWADPARLDCPADVVLRPRTISEIPALRSPGAVWIVPSGDRAWAGALKNDIQRSDVDPWSVLPVAGSLTAHGDDEWIALARIVGIPVRVLSSGRFGAPNDDDATLDRRAIAALTAAVWRDPFTGGASDIATVVDLLAMWRETLDGNRPIAAASGMAWWKRAEIRRFLWHPQRSLRIVHRPAKAMNIAAKSGGAVAIWPSRVSPSLIRDALERDVPLVRVEDGFVRSVGLGVDLVPPSSVVVDHSGIHFDPTRPSDLEAILNGARISSRLIERARKLRETIVAAGISKYAAGNSNRDALAVAAPIANSRSGRRLVLVPGQVEDDMSVLAGSSFTSNLELLRRARALEPEAEIWFRPHPDVDAGHRKGAIPDGEILAHADRIVRGGGMAALLDVVDAVHVMTSLTGFEALMRGRAVTCHGTPFYAGWGLTRDLGEIPVRRTRKLTLDELVAGVLIAYPRYLDPVTGLPCPPEVLVGRMAGDASGNKTYDNRLSWIAPLRRLQGKVMTAFRAV